MITGISIENFKGIRERVEIELRPITLLFGANSAGKSSILNAIHLAVELFERGDANPDLTVTGGSGIRLGGFKNFVHGHAIYETVWIKLRLSDDQLLWDALNEELDHQGIDALLQFNELETSSTSFGVTTEGAVEIGIRWSSTLDHAYIAVCRIELQGVEFAEILFEPGRGAHLSRLNTSNPALTAPEDWDVNRSREEETVTPLSEYHLNTKESCLSICLRETLDLFHRIEGGLSDQFLAGTPLLLIEGLKSALPSPGETIRLAAKEREDIPGSWIERPLLFADDDRQNPVERDKTSRNEGVRVAREFAEGIAQMILAPINVLRRRLAGFRALGAIREVPARHHEAHSALSRERWASGLAAWDLLDSGDDDFIRDVSDWLGGAQHLNSGYTLRRVRYKELDLDLPTILLLQSGRAFDEAEGDVSRDLARIPTKTRLYLIPESGRVQLRPSDVGAGISQVVPVIVTALEGKERLIAIEQPELHLHPKLQAGLADLFIEAAKGNAGHVVLLETHSELIPLRIMRRIREAFEQKKQERMGLTEEDVAIYYVEPFKGATVVTRLNLSERGQLLDPWPEGFFEEGYRERFSD